uniref:Ig-like domain-containing protein n=1 Tax=Microcebus murinus TaxID=30608 RepID=A0A8C5Y3Q4_MICMU
MTARDWATWLPPALLLLHVPGGFSLSCPYSVTGTVGGSLSVQCQYEKEFRTGNKIWSTYRDDIVATGWSEREVRNGRVSIKDYPESLTFRVTLDNLTMEDSGNYWCGIQSRPIDGSHQACQVKVSVFPDDSSLKSPALASWEPNQGDPSRRIFPVFSSAFLLSRTSTAAPSPDSVTGTEGPPTFLPAGTRPSSSGQDSPDPSPHPRCLLDRSYFLLLVLLKLPLLVGALGAVLWVGGPWGSLRARQCRPSDEAQ